MGMDTVAYIFNTDKNVYDVLEYLKTKYVVSSFMPNDMKQYQCARINFQGPESNRSIFVMTASMKDQACGEGFKHFIKSFEGNYIYLSLGADFEAVNIVIDILEALGGGYICENDCQDDIPPYEVVKGEDGKYIKPLIISPEDLISFYKKQTGFQGSVFIQQDK